MRERAGERPRDGTSLRKPWLLYAISASVHLAVLLGGGLLWVQQPQFGVQSGENSVEVDLVAAPAEPMQEQPVEAPAEPREEVPPPMPDPEDMVRPEEETRIPVRPALAPAPVKVQAPTDNPERGDGSSPVPGRDATTLHSQGGSRTPGKAAYLRNPLPVYPEDLRRAGKEGKVLLKVKISSEGRAVDVVVARSSGYEAMDRNAVTVVSKSWKFRPAEVGGVAVSTTQLIPIHFVIKQK